MDDLKEGEAPSLTANLDLIRECTELTRALCIASYVQRYGLERHKKLAPSVIRVITEKLLERLECLYAQVNA